VENNNALSVPDILFEVSWEICNKQGGIYTVIASKQEEAKNYCNQYILIGPDKWVDLDKKDAEFVEDPEIFEKWSNYAKLNERLSVRTGYWKYDKNQPIILIDSKQFINEKDALFARFWEKYLLNSISGNWDYIESFLFGYAAGRVAESFTKFIEDENVQTVAHFHEWQSGAGVLYLRDAAPYIGTVFTTHSTSVGRALASTENKFYTNFDNYNAMESAEKLGVTSLHSMEKSCAFNADCFTTVSNTSEKECIKFIEKKPDLLLLNGFNQKYIKNIESKRELIIEKASELINDQISNDAILIATASRLEYKNKGIDLFIDAVQEVRDRNKIARELVAFVLVPSQIYGPRGITNSKAHMTNCLKDCCNVLSHDIHNCNTNPIVNSCHYKQLINKKNDKVRLIYIPAFVNGNDGVFNVKLYSFLKSMDINIFPSYYDSWGYTPMESLSLGMTTVITNLSGFGQWAEKNHPDGIDCLKVFRRDDLNYDACKQSIADFIEFYSSVNDQYKCNAKNKALSVIEELSWKTVFSNYKNAYSVAIEKAQINKQQIIRNKKEKKMATNLNRNRHNSPAWKGIVVQSNFPDSLKDLNRIANNLWWCWNYEAKELFEELDPILWEQTRNPIKVLKEISYDRLLEIQKSEDFMFKYNWVVKKFDKYMNEPSKDKHRIAYFSMEYGLDDSLKIFSGGLGVLAGDYLKEASDTNTNMVAVGFLYKYGYFKQKLSLDGDQLATYNQQNVNELPVSPVLDDSGNQKMIQVGYPGRIVNARIWLTNVGRVKLYLLDTDFSDNSEEDRRITHALYGGDNENRLCQELLLGVGGVRTLEAVGEEPELWHCNEGHAAFINLERLRKVIKEQNTSFAEALEIIRASSLYTTHTPVPAGHDSFPEDLMMTYLGQFPERLQLSWNEFMNLGRMYEDNQGEHFSMSNLAANTCQEMNGVSRLHGEVSKDMFKDLWQGYFKDESHIGYVTNGVHYPTWTAKAWQELYEETFGDKFLNNQSDHTFWRKIQSVPDEKIWEIKQKQRSSLLTYVKTKLHDSWIQRYEDPKKLIKVFKSIDKNTLTIGFARRFATYKRAYLLFSNLEKLSKIVNNPERPVQFLFAGKAHPNDKPGQGIIKEIVRISKLPEFVGKVIFLEDYDMTLAKRLVQGVDIWLNTPTRPLEASGTSGMKAVMNGALNFSVLDGWWCEGYKDQAGWALPEERTYEDQEFQNKLDAEMIYSTLEYDIAPLFYNRDDKGIPHEWVRYVKNSVADIAPEFTTKRMIDDYKDRFYSKLGKRYDELTADNFAKVQDITNWKKQISEVWDTVTVTKMNFPDSNSDGMILGHSYKAEITLDTKGLSKEDIGIELIFTDIKDNGDVLIINKEEFKVITQEGNMISYEIDIAPSKAGIYNFGLRMFPKNVLLPHRQDFSFVRWL